MTPAQAEAYRLAFTGIAWGAGVGLVLFIAVHIAIWIDERRSRREKPSTGKDA